MPRAWSEAKKDCSRHPKKDKRGRWCSCPVGWRYRMGLPDPATGLLGKPQWSETFPTRELADQDQRDKRTAISDGTYAHDRGLTLAQFLEQWIAGLRATAFDPGDPERVEGLRPNTVNGYENQLAIHVIPYIGHVRLGQLRPHHIQQVAKALSTYTYQSSPAKPPKRLAAVTRKTIIGILHTALGHAVDGNLITQNWVDRSKPIQVVTRPPVDVGREISGTFLERIAGDRLEAMWWSYVLWPTRRSEILGLRWDDRDPSGQQFSVRRALVREPGSWACPFCGSAHQGIYFGPPKSQAGRRILPIIGSMGARLDAHHAQQSLERDRYGPDYADHGLVFCQVDGRPLQPGNISRTFSRIMQDVIVPGTSRTATLKHLRSSAVTALHEAGSDLEVITAVAGHTPDGAVTKKHYLTVRAERARPVLEAIAAQLETGRGTKTTADVRSDRQSDQRRPENAPDLVLDLEAPVAEQLSDASTHPSRD
ncbi:tyrosine-type recombinase/integrase [Kineosporia sp. NBRC 101731]|uniref:tyrosine-type recombinase/integrase n=1 Tax=Kineosporia sp. NBRC 101731 TaxID=3032199 RepID=UPI0024A42C6A|nr:tyrosine-type recombinase/integrase [Kineosporia sp. NBRC 101731]GLY31993.1 hypothetical protein Kisp02_53580 [Kineosporia sp. NBRC 101731]